MVLGIADLAGVRAKLRRAKEHLGTLKTEFDEWAKEHSDTLIFHIRRDGPWYVAMVEPIPEPDIRFCCIVGDIIYNLRSALDHLIWQLILRDGQEPSDKNQFPICTSKQGFINDVKFRKKTPKLGVLYGMTVDGDAWTIIEKAQPFQSTKPEAHPLSVIRRLSNLDKHRTLCVQIPFVGNVREAIAWSSQAVLLEERLVSKTLSFETPTEIVRYRFTDEPNPNVHMKGRLPIEPTFGEGTIKYGYQLSVGFFPSLISAVVRIVDEVSKLPRIINIGP